MNKPYDPNDIATLVHDYLARFHKHYKLPRHFDEEDELVEWCKPIGAQYKDWNFYKGHPDDQHCVLHILDPKWCTLFELRWGYLVIGMIDIK